MLESQFQARLIKELEKMFPECVVIKNDANYIQGFPDLTILFHSRWAILECKRSLDEPFQPNQKYYLELLNGMSFASMICPENREVVLHELQLALTPRRNARLPKR